MIKLLKDIYLLIYVAIFIGAIRRIIGRCLSGRRIKCIYHPFILNADMFAAHDSCKLVFRISEQNFVIGIRPAKSRRAIYGINVDRSLKGALDYGERIAGMLESRGWTGVTVEVAKVRPGSDIAIYHIESVPHRG